MRVISGSLIVVLSIGLSACTEPGETTEMAAATGGAIGAGLGAIIGSQTGSTGGGLVLGALAGGATGGAIGNALEAQEKTIRTQDEAIEKQDRTIAAQRTELEELRRMNQETPGTRLDREVQQNVYAPHASFGGIQPRSASPITDSRYTGAQSSPNLATTSPSALNPSAPMRESTLVDRSAEYQGRSLNNQGEDVRPNTAAPIVNAAPQNSNPIAQMGSSTAPRSAALGASTGAVPARMNATAAKQNTPECIQAEGEIGKANGSNELADKLFHYRRALRLCPDNPTYHNGLGEIYLALNRKADAEFEFHEALNVDSNYIPAQNNLNNLR